MLAHLREPVDVVHVVLELGDDDRRRRSELRDEVLDARLVARGERGQLVRGLVDPPREVLAERLGELRRRAAVDVGRQVHAVDHEPAERHPRVRELAVEVDRLLRRVVARRGDDQERRRRILEQRADAVGALREAVDHPAERAEEHRQVLQQVDAGDALEQAEHHPRPAPEHLAAQPRRPQEHPDRAAAEEALQPLRRVEEVERVARRRRVEHEQVEAAVLVELVELRDRRELLRAGDRVGELLVDPVGEHLVARARRRARAARSAVEGALGVEHHRPQLAVGLDAAGGQARGVDQPRLVAELLEPERGRRAASRGRSSRRRPAARARPCPSPSAAAVVVLPTPPEPAQMTIRFPSSSDSTEVIALTSARGSPAPAYAR